MSLPTRHTLLQKVRRRSEKLRLFVNIRFQVLFHSPPGVLFHLSFRRFSSSLSVIKEYFCLEGGPSGFHECFTCSRCTLDTTVGLQVSYTRLLAFFGLLYPQNDSTTFTSISHVSHNPQYMYLGFLSRSFAHS